MTHLYPIFEVLYHYVPYSFENRGWMSIAHPIVWKLSMPIGVSSQLIFNFFIIQKTNVLSKHIYFISDGYISRGIENIHCNKNVLNEYKYEM